MKTTGYVYRYLCLLAFGPIWACGTGTSPESISGGEPGGSNTGILGAWEGIYISKTVNNSQQEAPINVVFDGSSEESGRFSMRLIQTDSANVKGTFRNFAGKSLILSLQESSVSTLGLTGSTTDLPYDLTGNSLQLANDRVTIKLSRSGQNQQNPTNKSPADTSPVGLYGRWKCKDDLGKVWSSNIRPEDKFSIDVSNPNSGQSYLWLDGRVEKGAQGTPDLLVVERSSQPKYKGLIFKVEKGDDTSLSLVRSQLDNQNGTETIKCNRI
jgi:hypothetical protein